jgi:diacylglycerol kinase family enzyme
MLEEHTRRAGKNPLREGGLSGGAGLVFTKAAGHAGEIARALIGEAAVTAEGAPDGGQPFNLIITAGGDGTSREVMTALYYAPAEIRRDFVILRLPMGTGNDGADALSLDKALDLLIELTEIQYQRAIQLVTAGGRGPFLAFNILSVGLDAFVTHMTNKMKGRLPGDSYKLWVDIAALFYDRIYKVGFMDVLATDEGGNEVKAFREKVLLLAVGESGRRTYGSQKRILPDGRNVCAVMQMPLFRKFSLKNDFSRGTHAGTPEATLWNAARVEFRPQYPLLAQMDGETVLLGEKDFPAAIELSCPVIPVLKTKRENGSLLCFISREI